MAYLSLSVLGIVTLGIWLLINNVRKKWQKPSPLPILTDEEYEAWVKSWRDSLQQDGMKKLGLHDFNEIKVDRPLYLRSIVWPNSADADYYRSQGSPVLIKHGWNGRPHGSVNRFTFFYPTEHSIAVFTVDVKALDSMRFERTRTYFYQDIVGVETSTFNINDGQDCYVMQQFDLRISSGQSISATTHVHDLNVEETVQALRTLLKEKKQGKPGGNYAL